jgi:hypothetical protein
VSENLIVDTGVRGKPMGMTLTLLPITPVLQQA